MTTPFAKFQKLIKPYKQQIRGFLGWLFGLLAQVVVNVDAAAEWGLKRWLVGLGVAALPGIVGFMKGGDDNPTDEELYEKVHAVKRKRYVEGLEVTDPNGIPLKPAEPKP
jgi:hypothetical protein